MSPVDVRARVVLGLDEVASASLSRLTSHASTYGPRTQVLDDSVESVWLVAVHSGWACRSRSLSDGRRQVVELLLPGDVVSWHPTPGHSLEALSDCSLSLVRRGTVESTALVDATLSRALLSCELWSMSVMRESLANLGLRNGMERLAHLVCEVRARLVLARVLDADETTVPWPVTQYNLADVVNMTSVHVNRSLRDLRAEGLLHCRGRTLKVPDYQKLADYCEFDPSYLVVRGGARD